MTYKYHLVEMRTRRNLITGQLFDTHSPCIFDKVTLYQCHYNKYREHLVFCTVV